MKHPVETLNLIKSRTFLSEHLKKVFPEACVYKPSDGKKIFSHCVE